MFFFFFFCHTLLNVTIWTWHLWTRILLEKWPVRVEHILGNYCCIFLLPGYRLCFKLKDFALLSCQVNRERCYMKERRFNVIQCFPKIPVICVSFWTEVAAFPGSDGGDRRAANWSRASQIDLDASTRSRHRFLVRTDGWSQGNDSYGSYNASWSLVWLSLSHFEVSLVTVIWESRNRAAVNVKEHCVTITE